VRVTTEDGVSATSSADRFAFTDAPIVAAVVPVAGSVAGGTSVTIYGANLGTASTATVKFGTATAAIVSDDGSRIVATSPAGTGAVDVTVTTANGTSATSWGSQFYYVAVPSVSAISPTSGPPAGGTTVTITGVNLDGNTTVKFGTATASIVSNNGTRLVVTSPPGAAGTVDVTVTTTGGTSATSSADQFTYTAAPIVLAVSPTAGPSVGGTTVTITGANLGTASTATVEFGGATAAIVSDTGTQIVATSPPGTAGTVDVTVTTSDGTSATSAADQFTYVSAPSVVGISPASGLTSGGTSVTITGANLGTASTATVKFGTATAAIVSDTGTEIVATSPPGTVGIVDVTVTTAGGTSATSAADQFTYSAPPPTVSGISPSTFWSDSHTLPAGTPILGVYFSGPVLGGAADDYELVAAGPDGLLGTSDDVAVPLAVSYAGNTATLRFPLLMEDLYRLTIHDAIADTWGTPLDGDLDGVPGGDWIRDFVVVPCNTLFYYTPLLPSGGSTPIAVAAADFDGDGNLDIAAANSGDFTIGVLMGMGGGAFAAPTTFASGGGYPRSLASGDFNADGKPDLVEANDDSIAIFLGNGDGSFTPGVVFRSAGWSPSGVAISDFNADGKSDLVVAYAGVNEVGVRLGNGDGTFASQTTYATGGSYPCFVAVADLNQDQKADLVVTNRDSGTIGVFLGHGDGSFGAVTKFASGGSRPVAVACGDLDGDGNVDLAVANKADDWNCVGVLRGNGRGSFDAAESHAAYGDECKSVAIGDFDRDGTAEIAAGMSNRHVYVISRRNHWGSDFDGVGSFVTAADVNHDGQTDLVVAGQGSRVMTLLNTGRSLFTGLPLDPAGSSPRSVAVGDFNGDGREDLAMANSLSDTVAVYLGNGDGLFGVRGAFSSGGSWPSSIAVADFNGDGKADLVVANTHYASNTVAVFLGRGDGDFDPLTTFSSDGTGPWPVVAGDFNGDGNADFAVANYYSDTLAVFLGRGDGSFDSGTTFPTGGSHPRCLAIGDFNGDKISDLAVGYFVGHARESSVGVLLGSGDGRFALPMTHADEHAHSTDLAVGDFNGDGKADLAVTYLGAGALLFGRGDGSFSSHEGFDSGSVTGAAVAVGDFNADGYADLAVAGSNNTVGIILDPGHDPRDPGPTTVFPITVFPTGGTLPEDLAVGDFNQDSKPDLVVVNHDGEERVLLNTFVNTSGPDPVPLKSPHNIDFWVGQGAFGAGQLVYATGNALNGDGRLNVGGNPFQPGSGTSTSADDGCTTITGNGTVAGLTVSREITVPNTGADDFARTVDVFTNPTANPITATVRIVGNVGSDAATTVFATSDGDTTVDAADQWVGTDDADGTGALAVIHFIHGPAGLATTDVRVTGDNIEWTYSITVPAGQTVRLAEFTILGTTRAAVTASAVALVTPDGFGGQAAAFLTTDELRSIVNFPFTLSQSPTVTGVSPSTGPAAGGTTVTITGTKLTGATAVYFGSETASSFVVNSDTQITATSPLGSPGTVDVTVVTAGGTSATSPADQFAYVAAPAAPVITRITTDTGISATDGVTSDNTLVLNGTADADSLITILQGGINVGTAVANGLGGWSLDCSGTPLPEGTYQFTALARDMAGNVSPASAAFTVTVDTTPPTLTVNGLAANNATPTITGTFSDGALKVTINGKTYAMGDGNLRVSDTSWTLQIPAADALAEGTYDVSATATDVAGNVGSDTTTDELRIVLDDDSDGVSDAVEAGAPNGGDGNRDGKPDNQQANVASLPGLENDKYLTLAAPDGLD
jgi:hypothetical protein